MNIVKQDIWQHLKTEKKPIVLYGMGNGADKIIKALERVSVKPSGYLQPTALCVINAFTECRLQHIPRLKNALGI